MILKLPRELIEIILDGLSLLDLTQLQLTCLTLREICISRVWSRVSLFTNDCKPSIKLDHRNLRYIANNIDAYRNKLSLASSLYASLETRGYNLLSIDRFAGLVLPYLSQQLVSADLQLLVRHKKDYQSRFSDWIEQIGLSPDLAVFQLRIVLQCEVDRISVPPYVTQLDLCIDGDCRNVSKVLQGIPSNVMFSVDYRGYRRDTLTDVNAKTTILKESSPLTSNY